ncbi:MAG: phospholipase D-like domain-containing protein [Nocardioidaceae bacterium]
MSFSPRRTLVAALTTLSLTVTALTGLQGSAVAVDHFTPIPGPVFGDPTAASNRILSRLLNNINHTPRNGTIRIVGYSFSLGRVADALLAAKKRGVHLQIVLDGHSRVWSPSKRLDAVLGSDPSRRDYLVLTKGSARGTRGVTHQKSWQFSQVGQTPYVTMVGSTNLTGYGLEVQYSDMYTYVNRKDVYDAYASVQSRQKLDTPLVDPYVTKLWTNGSAYFFPYPAGSAETDPVVARINALPSDVNTTIRVSQFAWYDYRGIWIANALAAKKAAGATVTAVVGESVGTGVKGILTRAGIPMYPGVFTNKKRIHTKLMLASYLDATGPHTRIWTGSDNWTDQSFRNEDTIVEVDDAQASYDQYVGFYDGLITAGLPPVIPPVPTTPAPVQSTTMMTGMTDKTRVHRNRSAVMYGTVGPDFTGRVVKIQRLYRTDGAWHTVSAVAPLTTSSYRIKVPTGRLGVWKFRTVTAATTSPTLVTTAAFSPTRTVRVLR